MELSAEALEARNKYMREYIKKWRKANKDRCNAANRKWRAENKDKVAGYNAKYWEKKSKGATSNELSNN